MVADIGFQEGLYLDLNGELIFQSKENGEEEDVIVNKKVKRRRTSVRVEKVGREGERFKEHERRNIFKQIVYSPTAVEFIWTLSANPRFSLSLSFSDLAWFMHVNLWQALINELRK